MPIVVMENGRYCTHIGFSGENSPRSVFPTVFGRGRGVPVNEEAFSREYYVGEEAMALRGVLRLGFPVTVCGDLDDSNLIEKIWSHAFTQEIKTDPRETSVLMVVKPGIPATTIDKIADVMFNTFEVAGLGFADQAALSLAALGQQTGCVVDIGDSETIVAPVYAGKVVLPAVQRADLAGKDITKSLEVLLRARGFRVRTSAEWEIIRDMKEKLCYIAPHLDQECTKVRQTPGAEKQYMLPDGEGVSLGAERFMAPEILFDPKMVDKDLPSLPRLVREAVRLCGDFDQIGIASNIVLTGGTSLLPGLPERLLETLKFLADQKYKVGAPANRQFLGWVGGAMVGNKPDAAVLYVNRATFLQNGVPAFGNYEDRLSKIIMATS